MSSYQLIFLQCGNRKAPNSKLVTDCKSYEVMILFFTSAADNLMLSLLCRCPHKISW